MALEAPCPTGKLSEGPPDPSSTPFSCRACRGETWGDVSCQGLATSQLLRLLRLSQMAGHLGHFDPGGLGCPCWVLRVSGLQPGSHISYLYTESEKWARAGWDLSYPSPQGTLEQNPQWGTPLPIWTRGRESQSAVWEGQRRKWGFTYFSTISGQSWLHGTGQAAPRAPPLPPLHMAEPFPVTSRTMSTRFTVDLPLVLFLFLFLATSTIYRSSQARDRTCATAVTWATAVAKLYLLTPRTPENSWTYYFWSPTVSLSSGWPFVGYPISNCGNICTGLGVRGHGSLPSLAFNQLKDLEQVTSPLCVSVCPWVKHKCWTEAGSMGIWEWAGERGVGNGFCLLNWAGSPSRGLGNTVEGKDPWEEYYWLRRKDACAFVMSVLMSVYVICTHVRGGMDTCVDVCVCVCVYSS